VNDKTSLALLLSLFSNIILTFLKLIVGILLNSQVLVADGIHNAGDVAASIGAFFSLHIARRPADGDHPYGHGKAEIVAAGMVGIILFTSALWMLYQSTIVLLSPIPGAHLISFLAAVFSLFMKQGLYVYTIRIGKRARSQSLIATAYDHLADAYASLAAVLGIGLALLGDRFQIPYLEYSDPIAGIVVSFLILKLSVEIGWHSIDTLMEKNLDQDKMERYVDIILSVPEVQRIDRIRAREYGQYIIMDVRVSIPACLTIQEGHNVCLRIKQLIMQEDKDIREILIHLNPWYESG
jgi:cation diffusion facilitator family transporter